MTLRKPAVLLIAIAALSLEFPTVAHGSELGISPSQATPAQPTPLATDPLISSSSHHERTHSTQGLSHCSRQSHSPRIAQGQMSRATHAGAQATQNCADPQQRSPQRSRSSPMGDGSRRQSGPRPSIKAAGEERTRSHGPPATPDRPATGGGRGPRWISWAGPTIPPGRRAKPRCSAAREAAPPMRRRSRR